MDASLWYIIAAFHYIRYTKNFAFVKDHLWATMKDIIEHYQNGTRFHIRMDLDGLIYAGQAGTPLTWMDAKVGDQAVTLRAGKAVGMTAIWAMYRGPGAVVFGESKSKLVDGRAVTTASFSQPGEYILQVVVDDGSGESAGNFGYHCCWTNAQTKITVNGGSNDGAQH